MKEKHDKTKFSGAAMLYQNIIEYSLSSSLLAETEAEDKRPKGTFKITQIGYWLLKHNEDYYNYYGSGSASNIPQSNRIRSISKRITRYLRNLHQWGLVEQLGEVDSDSKNGLKTPLYRFTTEGYIVAWIIQYGDGYRYCQQRLNLNDLEGSVNRMKKAKHEIFELIKRLFSESFHSSMAEFISRFYAKCIEQDLAANTPFIATDEGDKSKMRMRVGPFDRIILAFIATLDSGNYHSPKTIEYLSAAHTSFLVNKESAGAAAKIYLGALDALPPETRNTIMAIEKAAIESNFVIAQPSKDWEKVWIENRSKDDILVLYAVCQNKQCERRGYPIKVGYHYYRQKLVSATTTDFTDGFKPIHYLIDDCPCCKKENSMYVFDSYDNVRRCMNWCLANDIKQNYV